jgi:lipocalin
MHAIWCVNGPEPQAYQRSNTESICIGPDRPPGDNPCFRRVGGSRKMLGCIEVIMLPVCKRSAAAWVIFAAALLLARPRAHAQTAVPKLNQLSFTGTWYEIARVPNKREKDCVSRGLVLIALGDKSNQLQFINSCNTAKGFDDTRNYTGRSKDGSGKLKIPAFFPLSRPYWVLAVGPLKPNNPAAPSAPSTTPSTPTPAQTVAIETAAVSSGASAPAALETIAPTEPPPNALYTWALVGTPNRKNLWIYSRTKTLPPDTLTAIKAQAVAEGFDAGKLVMPPAPTNDGTVEVNTANQPASPHP